MLFSTYLGFVLSAWAAGLLGGWWLRSRGARPAETPVDKDEVRRAQELLGSLRKMATTVATELGEHSTRVGEINGELAGDKLHDPTKILSVVTKLVDVNKTMQGRLDQAEDKLREQVRLVETTTAEARTDALTLVGNRRAFETDIVKCLADFRAAGMPFTLAMIDLDKFKRLNDTYGHQAGDEVLRGTGRVLRRMLRECDTIARYGGEEFAAIFTRSTTAEVQRALTRLRKAIAATEFQGPSGKIEVTISIGAAAAAGEETQQTIVERADAALYASKEAGRNCTHWHDGQNITRIAEEESNAAPAVAAVKSSAPTITPKATAPLEARPAAISAGPAAIAAAPAKQVVKPVVKPTDDGSAERLADDLPPLLNRTAFCQHVRARMAEWKRGGPTLSLVLVEIDQFHSLARTHGPAFRDQLVVSLARVVFAGVREMDMVARYSSACLGFLLPNAELPAAIRVADRIREAAGQSTIDLNGTPQNYTVSVGIIETANADDMVALFRKAQNALEAGHQHGGNCLFLHDGRTAMLADVAVGAA
jgi:diguanylate cyclase (GGDEF)-like protein